MNRENLQETMVNKKHNPGIIMGYNGIFPWDYSGYMWILPSGKLT